MQKILDYGGVLYQFADTVTGQQIKSKQISFTQAETLVSKHGKTVLILNSDQLSTAAKSFLKGTIKAGTRSKVLVAANATASFQAQFMRGVKAYAGPTQGLYRFLASFDPRKVYSDTPEDEIDGLKYHPAIKAFRYLSRDGDTHALLCLLHAIGDLRYPMAISCPQPSVASATIHKHSLFHPEFCLRPAAQLLRMADDYLRDRKASPLVVGPLGYDRLNDPTEDLDSFVGSAMARGPNAQLGVCTAVTAAIRLLVSDWLATEFHPEFFDNDVFLATSDPSRWSSDYKEACRA